MPRYTTPEELWHAFLTGKDQHLHRKRVYYKLLPSEPRCRVCNAPFGGIGGTLMRLMGTKPSGLNPHMCNVCEEVARAEPGGAVLEFSMLFADVRGSTTLAEHMDTTAYSQLISRFYRISANLLVDHRIGFDEQIG